MRQDAGGGVPEGDLSDAYANTPHIPDAATWPGRWVAAATAFRAALGARAELGLPYGPGPRNRFDLFRPEGAARGLVVFLHGGYWLAFGREDWSHLAAGAVARGFAVAMPSHTLAPEARIGAMVAELTVAVRAAQAAAGHAEGTPLVLTGHSAGGHMAARLACADRAAGLRGLVRVVPISPIGDLAPLMQTQMNADLRIDAAEAAAESPRHYPLAPGVGAHIWVGAAERPAFLEQAADLARAWGVPVTQAPGRHHFDVISDLADPDSALTEILLAGV